MLIKIKQKSGHSLATTGINLTGTDNSNKDLLHPNNYRCQGTCTWLCKPTTGLLMHNTSMKCMHGMHQYGRRGSSFAHLPPQSLPGQN